MEHIDDWRREVARLQSAIALTQQRLAQLEMALTVLTPLASASRVSERRTRRKNSDTTDMAQGGKQSIRRSRADRRTRRGLPLTGTDTWLDILGDAPMTAAEIVDSAMRRLQVPSASRKKIYSRVGNWLNGAVKKSLVTVVGQRDGANVYQRT